MMFSGLLGWHSSCKEYREVEGLEFWDDANNERFGVRDQIHSRFEKSEKRNTR
jgi:hypothetical protein